MKPSRILSKIEPDIAVSAERKVIDSSPLEEVRKVLEVKGKYACTYH